MIGTALKKLAVQYQLAVSNGIAYGYLQGSYVTLTTHPCCHRMSIYVGSVNVPLNEGEEFPPAVKCSAMITDMVTKASGEENIYGLLRNRFIPALVVNHSGSVMTLNFRLDHQGINGLQRFVAELLPRITPLTAPLQCSCCGGHTGGQGYPVKITDDTIVPMHTACCQEYVKKNHRAASVLPGIIGAAAGALLGAFAWAAISHLTGIAALGCLLVLILTLGGYKLLHGKRGRIQMITIGVCMAAAVSLGILANYVWIFNEQYAAYGNVVGSMMRESVYMRVMFKTVFTDGTALADFLRNHSIGLAFYLIGAASGLMQYKGAAEASAPHAMPGQA